MTSVEAKPRQAGGPLSIPGNVDPSTGDVSSAGDIVIGGSVADSHTVRGASGVVIGGSVDNARVYAGGKLAIGGGAIGRERCLCVAGGDLNVRHVNGATLESGANLAIQTNAAQARIICAGRLTVLGALSGGHVTAAAGVVCKTLGSPAGVPTTIEVGIDESLRRLAAERLPALEQRAMQLGKMKTAVAPLVRNQKALTAGEKERATELLYEIQELEEQVGKDLSELRVRHEKMQGLLGSSIVVEDVIHAGVIVRIGAVEARVETAIKGPITIAHRHIGNLATIVMCESAGSACSPLTTAPFHDAVLDQLARILITQE